MLTSNRSSARLARLLLAGACALAWTGAVPVISQTISGNRTQRSGADPAVRAEAADQLEKLLKCLEIADRTMPRDSFEPQAVLESVGRDPQALADWVRQNTCWVPYQGALRGPVGVLMDRTGNSLDRALLLGQLLKLAGHEVRIARAELPEADARKLLPMLSERLAKTPPRASDNNLADSLPSIAKSTGVDESVLQQEYTRRKVESERLSEELAIRSGEQAKLVGDAIGAAPALDRATDEARTLACLRAHYWVQLKRGQDWADLDPLTADGSLASAGLTPAETIDVNTSSPLQPIKPEDSHRLKVSVVVEVLNGGQLKQEVALEHTFRPADVLGSSIVLRHSLIDGADVLGAGGDPRKSIAIAAEHKKWLPTLWVGNAPYADNGFDASGQLTKAGDTSPAGKLGGATGGAFGGMMGGMGGDDGSGRDAGSHLTAEWIEYTVLAPGADPTSVRREVFDLLGPAMRHGGPDALKDFKVTTVLKARRGLALRGDTEMLPMASRIAPEFLDHLRTKAMLANGPMLLADLRRADPNKPLRGLSAPVPSGALSDLARVRFENSPQPGRLYLDRLNVLALQRQFTVAGEDSIAAIYGFDIVINELAARPSLSGQDAFTARMQQGVLETNAEELLRRRFAAGGNPDSNNAAAVMDRAATAGQAPLCVRNAEELGKLSNLSADTSARMKESLAAGYWVVTASPSATAGEGWYCLDPRSGTVLGIGSRGWGAGLTEFIQVVVAVETLAFCFEGQGLRVYGQHRDGAAGITLLLVCVAVAGATFTAPFTAPAVLLSFIGGMAAGLSAS